MPRTFQITLSSADLSVAEEILLRQKTENPDGAPADVNGLIAAAVDGMILAPWRLQVGEADLVRAHALLSAADPDVRAAVIADLDEMNRRRAARGRR